MRRRKEFVESKRAEAEERAAQMRETVRWHRSRMFTNIAACSRCRVALRRWSGASCRAWPTKVHAWRRRLRRVRSAASCHALARAFAHAHFLIAAAVCARLCACSGEQAQRGLGREGGGAAGDAGVDQPQPTGAD
jgi:hypothetical protein